MTTMPPRGFPEGSARQARIGPAPSGFSSIQAISISFGLSGV
jgi:hypothetical protein